MLLLQSILWAGVSAINTTRYPVLLQVYEVDRVGSSLFLASLIDLFFFPCALGAFILMDCLVVTAPRTRSCLAFTLLFMLLERLGNYYGSDLPSSLERAGLVGSTAWSKCPPLAVLQLGSCASSGRAWRLWAARHSQEEAGPLGAPPLPRVLERAASKAADFHRL